MKLFDKTHKVALAVSFLLCSFEIPVNCMAIAALFDGDDACGDDNFVDGDDDNDEDDDGDDDDDAVDDDNDPRQDHHGDGAAGERS